MFVTVQSQSVHSVIQTEVLLKKLVPYHCLDSIGSQWDMKYKNYLAPTIHTTINQFETMVSSVITTSLGDQSMKDSDQA
jgi:hypothetical protein